MDEFLARLLVLVAEEGLLVALTSDHGNIEDASAQTHTMNPVPFVAVEPVPEGLRRRVKSVVDVTPALLEWFGTARFT